MGIGAKIQMTDKPSYKNFIGVYPNVYPEGYCQHLIEQFELIAEKGAGANRLKSEGAEAHTKNDYQVSLSLRGHNAAPFKGRNPVDIYFDGLQQCYEQYAEKYSVLKDNVVRATDMKMQRTDPGGGYHIWHAEQGNNAHANRVLAYMLYLTTLQPEQAGETEFLYQQERYQPIENTMIIWPATYTHAHRGNTVFGEKSKYIVTGWFYYD
jgi:hypothetical protein